MKLGGDFRFEYEGDILVVGMDMPGKVSEDPGGILREINFAYSITHSLTPGARSFFIMRIF